MVARVLSRPTPASEQAALQPSARDADEGELLALVQAGRLSVRPQDEGSGEVVLRVGVEVGLEGSGIHRPVGAKGRDHGREHAPKPRGEPRAGVRLRGSQHEALQAAGVFFASATVTLASIFES